MEWISVKERLPETDEAVIACQAGAEDNAYEAIYYRDEWWKGCAPVRPTHWMPYPEPPKLEQFYTFPEYGSNRYTIYLREHGPIWSLAYKELAQELCDILNNAWNQALGKEKE